MIDTPADAAERQPDAGAHGADAPAAPPASPTTPASVAVVPIAKPVTPRRLARMRGTLTHRQPGLAVVIEDLHDAHNVSAILRSCEAVGALSVHLVFVQEPRPLISGGVSVSAQRWLDLHWHTSIDDCYAVLRSQGMRIVATTLGENSHEVHDLDLAQPTALVFGNEVRGVSARAIAGADASVFIPMMGMIESLNVSVACGVVLYEALRQRQVAGMYAQPQLPADEVTQRLAGWLERDGRDPAAAYLPLDVAAGAGTDAATGGERIRARNRHESRPFRSRTDSRAASACASGDVGDAPESR